MASTSGTKPTKLRESREARQQRAARPDLSDQEQEELSQDSYLYARAWLAGNPILLPGLQGLFTQDPEIPVRRALARNEAILPATQLLLAHDPSEHVRTDLARNRSLTDDVEDLLAEDHDHGVRGTLANFTHSDRLQEIMSQDSSGYVHECLAQNSRISERTQAALVQTDEAMVHFYLWRNPGLVLGPHLPVPFLELSESGQAYLATVLADADPAARRALAPAFSGTLRELLAVLESFAPA